ncbi:xylulokinase [Rhizobium alvei]|uniref:FGGY-family carbohydrate kinase n=1 Tax=Rhizobium alvei TaxID=1132659 RepID=A0ABT8YIF4_9HYPH|nr:FGGY-family carbohydrate kinase [Rhizobium alvei]MDO6963374.1 FGGY-family carbohydrate kinase [Rhizobium alvei]
MARYYVGLDAGSSICKAAIFDRDGRQLSEAARRTPLSRPNRGWSELDPDTSWNATLAVIAEAVASSGIDPAEIGGIGLSAAMVGAWIVDGDGMALRPGIIWEDSRSQPIIDEMVARDPGVLSRIFLSSGSVMQQGCTLPVVAWLARHEPEMLARARHVLSYKDYLRLKLTGKVATDRSEASVIPGSAEARDRSDAMITLFDLGPFRPLFPEVRNSEEFIGGLTETVANRLGLPAGLPVTIGAGDVAATVIGAGGLHAGSAIAVLGTTVMVGICHDRPVFAPADVGLLFSLPGDLWYRSMVNVAGTLNLDWAIETLAPDLAPPPDRYQRVTALAESVPIGARDLVYLPYLSESGIIAPVVDPAARAQFSGLSPRHGRAELFRAVFEGVAFALRDLFDTLGFVDGSVLLTGGGGRSAFWSQMIADILARPIVVPEGTQFGARGAALLAATAAGDFANIREASAAVRGGGVTYHPDLSRSHAYTEAHARYRHHRDRLLMKDL